MRQFRSLLIGIIYVFIIAICLLPFVVVIFGGIYISNAGISFDGFYDVFIASSKYLVRFWKSLGFCVCIMLGQCVISVLAGYGFAKYDFAGKKAMYFFLLIIMILPIQVTLVPNYIMMDRLNLLGTYGSLILPAIFLPLGTFIMTQSFKAVTNDVIDMAKIDGCNLPRLIVNIAMPLAKSGIVCTAILSFLDAWNMIEQPITYLKTFEKFPISVALTYLSENNSQVQFVCCLLVLLPPLFLFTFFNKELVEGIVMGGEK